MTSGGTWERSSLNGEGEGEIPHCTMFAHQFHMETLVSMEIWAVGEFRVPQNPVHKAPLTSLDQSRVFSRWATW
jgi:hypothetical protein